MLMLFLSSLDNLLQDDNIIFQKGVDNFEISTKHANFWLGVQYPFKQVSSSVPSFLSCFSVYFSFI